MYLSDYYIVEIYALHNFVLSKLVVVFLVCMCSVVYGRSCQKLFYIVNMKNF